MSVNINKATYGINSRPPGIRNQTDLGFIIVGTTVATERSTVNAKGRTAASRKSTQCRDAVASLATVMRCLWSCLVEDEKSNDCPVPIIRRPDARIPPSTNGPVRLRTPANIGRCLVIGDGNCVAVLSPNPRTLRRRQSFSVDSPPESLFL
ncbi:hypothetical protein OH77DRAFT_903026 [Trametes cingulata]|nr:hypothetical protein OH77DRAFT_903026 [Trametes cingulata]